MNLKCTQVQIEDDKAPFATLECPQGYQRNGCCRCTRKCNDEGLLDFQNDENWTDKNYCIKKESYESSVISKQEYYTHLDHSKNKDYEAYYSYFVEKCGEGFQRVGPTRCIAVCPLGWPDLGDRCHKKGDIILMPFIWTVGDGQM